MLSASGQPAAISNERLLVVGGGGARGAWAGGFVKHLTQKHHKPYHYVFGTSTGSLLAPMIVLNDFETLEDVYTTVTQKKIFNVNPFKKNGDLKKFKAALRLLRGKKTFGESYNLLNTIQHRFKPEHYNQIISGSPERQITVCTVNYEDGCVRYAQSGSLLSYEEMCYWIWASSNQPLFMTFVDEKYLSGGTYVDGGVRENIPVIASLAYAQKKGIYDIDIIVSKPIDPIIDKSFEPKGILKNLLRLIKLWEMEVRNDDIIIAKLLSELRKTDPPTIEKFEDEAKAPLFNLNFHFIPRELFKNYENELVFDQEKMKHLWKEGEKGIEDGKGLVIKVSTRQLNRFLEKYTFQEIFR